MAADNLRGFVAVDNPDCLEHLFFDYTALPQGDRDPVFTFLLTCRVMTVSFEKEAPPESKIRYGNCICCCNKWRGEFCWIAVAGGFVGWIKRSSIPLSAGRDETFMTPNRNDSMEMSSGFRHDASSASKSGVGCSGATASRGYADSHRHRTPGQVHIRQLTFISLFDLSISWFSFFSSI